MAVQDELLADSRVAVLGAGALGSLYGAVMARGGADVQLLARREHARAIEAQGGVHVRALTGAWFARLRATADPAQVEPADVVVVMAKTPDTEATLSRLDHLLPSIRLCVSWQNGLSKNSSLAAWCGPERVIGGASMVGAVGVGPGTIHHTFTGPTFVGELPAGKSTRTGRLAELLESGGLPAVDTDDIRSVEWSKLVQVLPAMSLTALTRLPYHQVLTSTQLSRLFARLLAETAAVAIADGVEIADWPAMLPVATLATLTEGEAAQRIRQFGATLEDAGQVHVKPSMLQSIERGRRLEVEAIQGHVARAADRLGVDAPTVRFCHELLTGIDATLS